jgi:arsenate reductase
MKRILVLCTGNSCRSVMAEALINHMGSGQYTAVSAGSQPTGSVHPRALEMLAHHGVPAGSPRSKSWDEFRGQRFDMVLTVCDQAASETCPVFLGPAVRLHWSIPDPAKAGGSQDEICSAFEAAFALLRNRIEREIL